MEKILRNDNDGAENQDGHEGCSELDDEQIQDIRSQASHYAVYNCRSNISRGPQQDQISDQVIDDGYDEGQQDNPAQVIDIHETEGEPACDKDQQQFKN
jgi:hypothetical protein